MARLVWVNQKATVPQITTRYNRGMQQSISEFTRCQTLKQMGYRRRRPHWAPPLSAKKTQLRRDPPHMIVKHFGCTTIHNKALYKCIIHSFINSTEATVHMASSKRDNGKLEKRLPGLMSFDFCSDFRMVGSELDMNNMNEWNPPALYEQIRLLLV